jgi:ADP-heptose:LPS heptosyltransferase
VTSVLFVRLSAMGDLVQGLGAVQALHEARPDWRLSLVTQAPFLPLLEGFSGLAQVIPFEREGGLAALLRMRRALRAGSFDFALDLQGNWKSASIAWLSGARERIGASATARQEPHSRLLLHRTIAVPGPPHPAKVAAALVRALVHDAPFRLPRLSPTDAELERERASLAAAGVDWHAPIHVVVAADPGDPRSLRPPVIEIETRRPGVRAVLLFGPDDPALAIPGVPTVRHGREPRRLIALGALVAASGGFVLGPDRGATHGLAAAGARCMVWFGSQDPQRTSPPSARAMVHPQPPNCSPCRSHECRHPDGPVCMEFDREQGRQVDLGC